MVVIKFRSESDANDTLKKLKRMQKVTDEIIECFEDNMMDDNEDDDDDEEFYRMNRRNNMDTHNFRRYRRR